MAFNPNKPQSNQSPALFPAENKDNMDQLQKIVSADHQFNNDPLATDGYHKLLHILPTDTSTVVTATTDLGQLYTQVVDTNTQLLYMGSTGPTVALHLSPRAAVNFDATPVVANGADLLSSQLRAKFNVARVQKVDTGSYKVYFDTPMPSANYYWSVSAFDKSNNNLFAAPFSGNAFNYSDAITTTFIYLLFRNESNTKVDPIACSLLIYGG